MSTICNIDIPKAGPLEHGVHGVSPLLRLKQNLQNVWGLLFAPPPLPSRSHKPSYGPEKENIRDELQRKHLTVRSFQKESFYAELTN